MDQITDDHPHVMNVIQGSRSSYGDDMGAFLCFMAVRLLAMKRVLKDTGSIYLHCDPTASHYLKELMDSIFGHKNFRNEIVWSYQGTGEPKRYFKRKHDYLLFYSKSNNYFFSNEGSKESISEFSKSKFNKKDSIGTYKDIKHSDGKIYRQYVRDKQRMRSVWEIPIINVMAKERTGYPTQKPIALYERIIKASSSEGDIVLDPFAGCATTCVAAERLGRKWVGIDIWDKAHEVIVDRLKNTTGLFGKVYYENTPPVRTDDGETSAPFLRVKVKVKEPEGKKKSRQEMYDHLISQQGQSCQGCDRTFDDPRYLELDHNNPRADGGINHISNRILICSPCNRAKSNIYTLSGLRRENKKKWLDGEIREELLRRINS